VALTLLLHKLVTDTFQRGGSGGCLEVSVRHVFFQVQASDLKDSPSATSIAARQEAWRNELAAFADDTDENALWNWLHGLDSASRLALLAHCVSYGVNALQEKVDRYGGTGISPHGLNQRLTEANRLAAAVNLDMVEAGWKPTADNYLSRVTKPRILEAVREGAGEQAAELIAHLKKGDMAREAERLLTDTGWLPEPLRILGDEAAIPAAHHPTGQGDPEADPSALRPSPSHPLPAFLSDEDDVQQGPREDEAPDSLYADRSVPPALAAE
jgi:ParB family chromosome partitioning protein